MRSAPFAILAAASLLACKLESAGTAADDLDDSDVTGADADATVDDTSIIFPTDSGSNDSSSSDSPTADSVSDTGTLDTGTDAGSVRDGTYPTAKSFKGVLPDTSKLTDIINVTAGHVLYGVLWNTWEPIKKAPPCAAATETEFDGHCFVVDAALDANVKTFTNAGVIVAALVVGTPPWANATRIASCKTAAAPVYCAPDDPNDFARFLGMLAARYGDKHPASIDHGRISDWIVWSFGTWQHTFDVGAAPTGMQLKDYWIQSYVSLFTKGYDAIMAGGDEMRVYPLIYPYVSPDDFTTSPNRLNVTTILSALGSNDSTRTWRVALYPQAVDVNFAPTDNPAYIDFGTLGRFTGWLDADLGSVASRRRVQIFEAVFDAAPTRVENLTGLTGPAAQSDAMCRAYREALATPTIDQVITYYWQDAAADVTAGAFYGLVALDATPRLSFTKWATMDTSSLDCGFEVLPYVTLSRRISAAGSHWVTTRMAAGGLTTETRWKLLRNAAPATHELFECVSNDGVKHFVSFDIACEGQTPLGSLGHTYDATSTGKVEIFRCDSPSGSDSIVTQQAGCESNYKLVSSLGFAVFP